MDSFFIGGFDYHSSSCCSLNKGEGVCGLSLPGGGTSSQRVLDKNVTMSGRGRCLREHNKGGDNRGTELTFGEQLPRELGDTGNLWVSSQGLHRCRSSSGQEPCSGGKLRAWGLAQRLVWQERWRGERWTKLPCCGHISQEALEQRMCPVLL